MKPSPHLRVRVAALFLPAALAAGGIAHGATLGFESALDTSQALFAPILTHGVPLYEGGYMLTPLSPNPAATDMDLVGLLVNGSELAATCSAVVCPANNASTFFASLDDSALRLSSAGAGVPFTLGGFSASFVGNGHDPLPTSGNAGMLKVVGVLADGSGTREETFALSTVGVDGLLGFSTFASSFAATPLLSVSFSALRCDAQGVCSDALSNKAQFALDDIQVSAVPEPATWCMAALGLAAVIAMTRGMARRERHQRRALNVSKN